MSDNALCPDCQLPMEEGYLPDRGYTRVELTRWIRGKPALGLWGLKGFFWKEPTGIAVATYRCPKCGYLKSYAR